MSEIRVPLHDTMVLRPKRATYAVCVFVLNEGKRVRRQLEQMRATGGTADIVVADGGSTDDALRTEFLTSCEVTALLVKRGPGGLSAQMRMALFWCLEQGYEGVITIDGNNKDDVSAIPAFVDALREGFDHVQGSRYVRGGRGINTPLTRHLGVKLLHAPLISLAAGVRYTDTTNGFRAYSRRFLTDPRVQPFRDAFIGYELHYYLAIRAGQLGFRTTELPVTRSYPRGEPTPSKIRGWRGNVGVLLTLIRAVSGAYSPRR